MPVLAADTLGVRIGMDGQDLGMPFRPRRVRVDVQLAEISADAACCRCRVGVRFGPSRSQHIKAIVMKAVAKTGLARENGYDKSGNDGGRDRDKKRAR